jgi:hypothetical protein
MTTATVPWYERYNSPEQRAARRERDARFAALAAEADAAGRAAAEAVRVTPMIVVERADPLDDSSPIVRAYPPVMDGVCGFAWVSIYPGTCAFARYAKKHLGFRADSYAGGVRRSVAAYNQSMTRKEAYARAFADVLQRAGIKAYANSRLD